MEKLAILIAGVALGLAFGRWIVQIAVGHTTLTMCDYCRYRQGKAADKQRPEEQ